MNEKLWEITVQVESEHYWLYRTFKLQVEGDEREIQILLDSLLIGCSTNKIKASGEMKPCQ